MQVRAATAVNALAVLKDREAAPSPAVELTALNALKAGPLTTIDGQKLKVSFAVDPVISLQACGLAGYRVEARMLDLELGRELNGEERRKLLPSDFGTIDLAALERGMSRLSAADANGPPKLVIQLSFASLSNSRARTTLIQKAASLQHLLRHAAICELVDVEVGVPVPRLEELAAAVRPYFRSLWLQVQPRRTLVEAAKSARILGLSVRASDLGKEPEEVARGMRSFTGLVQDAAQLLTITGLPDRALMLEALATGFTHATIRAPT
jgi:hypothetical protein